MRIFVFFALCTFVMIFTHQMRWTPIHGDGAVYAHLMREASQTYSAPLHWRRNNNEAFFDHPYLFFFASAPVLTLLGSSDWAVKVPNTLVAFFALLILFYFAMKPDNNLMPGLLSAYFLALTPGFEHQTHQPMLDPMAQVLALLSFCLIAFQKRWFWGGIVMGFAFMTKGLELLPNFGAIFLFLVTETKHQNRAPHLLRYLAGTLAIVLIALSWDFGFHDGAWTLGYIQRQLTGRFLAPQNFEQSIISLNFLIQLLRTYQPGLTLLAALCFWVYRNHERDLYPLFRFFLFHSALTVLAFTLIKKDSFQHLTGIYLSGSLVFGPAAFRFFNRSSEKNRVWMQKMAKGFAVLVFAVSLGVSGWLLNHSYNKRDLWGNIQNAQSRLSQNPSLPVIIESQTVQDLYGLYFTAQWYWPNPLFYDYEIKAWPTESYYLLSGNGPEDFILELKTPHL